MGMVTWTTEARRIFLALRRLRSLPRMESGLVRHPFQWAAKESYLAHVSNKTVRKGIETAPIKRVALRELLGIQLTVNPARVKEYLEDPIVAPGTRHERHGGLVDFPIVVRFGGRSFIHDGHHRLTASHLRGERTARVRLVILGGAP